VCSVRYRTVNSVEVLLICNCPRVWTLLDCALQNILLIQDDTATADSVRNALTHSCDGIFRVVWVRNCLHMRVVAEGVETSEQLAFLQDGDCPFGQGYYFGPPLTGQECTNVLRPRITVKGTVDQVC
jgi:hypothetical protein